MVALEVTRRARRARVRGRFGDRAAPSLALQFNADVSFHIVMSGEDLGCAGLDAIGKAWR